MPCTKTLIKKTLNTLLSTLLLLAITSQVALGANHVSEIYVDVGIYDDGSAYITQDWRCNFTEGTEGYIPIENLGEMSISDFLVSDINGPYTFVEDWDINASFAEKAGKYGIVETNNGYELCWGISEYGETRYAIEYKINHLVGAYIDADGFNFQFINSGMGTLPTDVTVAITMQDGIHLDANNAGIWAFGFDGQINFENGKVIAYTEKPLSSNTDSVIIMLQLNKGLINPTRQVNTSFEEVKAQAIKGSDYEAGTSTSEGSGASTETESGPYDVLIGFAMFVVPMAAIYYFIARKSKPEKKIRNMVKNTDYYREIPVAGNLEASFVLARKFGQSDDDGNLIGAAFLKLINAGCLEPVSEKSIGFFGKEKENISLTLVYPPEFSGVTTRMLFELLVKASGKDQILQESELESYCTRHNTAILKIIEAAKQDGNHTLNEISCYDTSKEATVLGLSQRGETLLLNVIGFKKYLLDFSLIGERSIAEVIIWQDYLTFATLFGIADKALEQFKKVYPEVTQYSENARYYYLLSHRFTKASYHTPQAARSSGGGGRSSFGGGGGFSGGGGGGGAR